MGTFCKHLWIMGRLCCVGNGTTTVNSPKVVVVVGDNSFGAVRTVSFALKALTIVGVVMKEIASISRSASIKALLDVSSEVTKSIVTSLTERPIVNHHWYTIGTSVVGVNSVHVVIARLSIG